MELSCIIFSTADGFGPGYLAETLTKLGIPRRQIRAELEVTIRHELGHDYTLERAEAMKI
ncbi:MAG: hypothetical protein AABX98_00840 [Nanoarchaeota archaeon]